MSTTWNKGRMERLVGGLLLAAAGWLAGSAPALAAPVTITGTAGPAGALTVTPNILAGQNTNFTSCNSGPWNYKLYTFTVDASGTYTASVVTPTVLNTTYFLRGTFTPSTTPCSPAVRSQFLVSSLATGLPNTATFTGVGLSLQAGVLYSVLIAFNTPHVGSQPFTFTMNGPGCIAIDTNACDPSKNAEVIGLVTAQVDAAKRFAAAQTLNFQGRLESLHRRTAAPAETGAAASGDAPRAGQARGAAGAGPGIGAGFGTAAGAGLRDAGTANPMGMGGAVEANPTGGNSMGGNAMGGNPGNSMGSGFMGNAYAAGTDPRMLPPGMQGAPDPLLAQASGSGLPSGVRLNNSQQNVMGTGIDIWSAGVVNLGTQGSTNSRFTTAGISVGADKRFSEKLVLGIGGGFAHDRQKIGGNGTRNTGESYSLSVYGSYQPADHFFIDGLVGYGQLRFDAQRYVTENGAIALSGRSGSQWFASLAGGYDHEFEYRGRKMMISPYARVDLARTRLNETTESNGAQFNLAYSAQDIPTASLALGMRGEASFRLRSGAIARPYIRVEYLYDFAKAGVAQMRLADQLSGVIYQMDSVSNNTRTARLGLGSRYQFRNAVTLDVFYQFSYTGPTNTQINTFAATLSKTF